MPAGAPRQHDREKLRLAFFQYIEDTPVPIAAEFAYKNGLHRTQLYEMEELSDALKLCITKKEAALESGALKGDLNTTMCIFSLKQIGWKDHQTIDQKVEHTTKLPDNVTAEDAGKAYLLLIG